MVRHICSLLLSLLLFLAASAHAEQSFMVSPSVGNASINNISGYKNSSFLRIDGSYYPLPEIGIGVFIVKYSDFESSGAGNKVAIKMDGSGVGLTAKLPIHPHVQPYVRIEYMRWNAEATGLGRTLGTDKGGSTGLALGMQFPIRKMFGVKAEAAGYNKVSGANIRQFSVGLTLKF